MTGEYRVAKVAVSSAVFSFDKPFEYELPWELGDVSEGDRVIVPFGQGNVHAKGFVLSLDSSESASNLKQAAYVYHDDIKLSKDDIALALWMRNRYFCSFFDCANAMIPPAAWYGKSIDKYQLSESVTLDDIMSEKDDDKKAVLMVLKDNEEPASTEEIEKAADRKSLSGVLTKLAKSGYLIKKKEFSEGKINNKIKAVKTCVSELPDKKIIGRGATCERRTAALEYLIKNGETTEKELCYQTGAQTSDISYLNRKNLVEIRDVPRYTASDNIEISSEPFVFSPKQKEVFDGILRLAAKGAGCGLLHGITGSGKTAIYIELIRSVITMGKSAMMLVPEIALTPQMLKIFKSHFGNDVAVIHSGLSPTERYDEYMRIKTGRAKVVLGTRSAVFAPCENLGIIIVDEEHEQSYKSDDAQPRYNAVEIAKYRCVKNNCLLLLGSATPSVESYYNAANGKYKLFTLDERFYDAGLPGTFIADMKESFKDGDVRAIGAVLREEIANNLACGEQTILFINRRGNAKFVMCAECGYIPQCENCSVPLIYHSANNRMMCHHCGYSLPFTEVCPQCGGRHMKLIGCGTQKVEEEIYSTFPQARVLRMDADTTTGRRSHEEILDAFAKGEADILLGTQMVAKGLDFPNVTLVGVIDADVSLYSGSYLSGERSFSLISQVAGRAGRRDKPGRAIIQSFSPSNPIIAAASQQDYLSFYNYEIDVRKLVKAPPFYDIFTFFFTSPFEERAENAAKITAQALKKAFEGKYASIAAPVLGPAPATIAKINNKYRYIVTFKGKADKHSRALVHDILMWFSNQGASRQVTIAADVNALYY